MHSVELSQVKSSVRALREKIPGSTPDERVNAIVEAIQSLADWAQALEDKFSRI